MRLSTSRAISRRSLDQSRCITSSLSAVWVASLLAYSVVMLHDGNSWAISEIRLFTCLVFSSSEAFGSRVSTPTTCVSVYSEVSSHDICSIARCILMPRKYLGFLAMDSVALKVRSEEHTSELQ